MFQNARRVRNKVIGMAKRNADSVGHGDIVRRRKLGLTRYVDTRIAVAAAKQGQRLLFISQDERARQDTQNYYQQQY